MALDQSARLALVESMKASDSGALMRQLLAPMLQELVDTDATGGDRRRVARAHRDP